MSPVPEVAQSRSVKFTFTEIGESYRVFAIIEADENQSAREMRDASGRSFYVASQKAGWVSRLRIRIHRSQQPLGLRTAWMQSMQSGEEILIRDYDTAQIYKGFMLATDPKYRTRIKWSNEHFEFEIAVIGEGVFDVEDEDEITWRDDGSTLVPERGYPY